MAEDFGFIGIGKMGFHMAGNVRKKMESSATLHIFDVNKEVCQLFTETFSGFGKVKVAESSKDVARNSSTVISMVPMDKHALAVYLDKESGVIAAPSSLDRLILECSTLSVNTSKEIGEQIMKSGVGTYVDAPVSGGVGGAEAGTLSFFCGYSGAVDTDPMAKRTKDTASWMGAPDRINFCGYLGGGLVSKIVNNYIGLSNIAVAAQAMAFGIRHGMDKKTLYQCIKGSSGDSWVWDFVQPAPGVMPRAASSNGFKAGFTPRLCVKDVDLAIKAAEEVGIDASMGKVALNLYEQAAQDPRTADLDCSSIWLHINNEVDAFAASK